MSDDIGPAATEAVPAAPETFSETMPRLLISLLERRYLADFQSVRWQVSPTSADPGRPLLREVRGMGRPQAGEDRGRRHRQRSDAHADRVVDRVADRGGRRNVRRLGDSIGIGRAHRPIVLENHDVDLRSLAASADLVVLEVGVQHAPRASIQDSLLKQGERHAHEHPALHLALDLARIDRSTAVLHRDHALDAHDSGLGIHGNRRKLHTAEILLRDGCIPHAPAKPAVIVRSRGDGAREVRA